MKQLAIFSALSKKFKDGEVKFFDNFEVSPAKTKTVASLLKPILGLNKNAKKLDVLMIPDPETKNLSRIMRNLPKTKVLSADSLNVYDLLNYKRIFIEQNAVGIMGKNFKRIK